MILLYQTVTRHSFVKQESYVQSWSVYIIKSQVYYTTSANILKYDLQKIVSVF